MDIDWNSLTKRDSQIIKRHIKDLEMSFNLKVDDEIVINMKVNPISHLLYGKIIQDNLQINCQDQELEYKCKRAPQIFIRSNLQIALDIIEDKLKIIVADRAKAIYAIKLHQSHKLVSINYDNLNSKYKLELCEKLLSFAKLDNRRLTKLNFRFELESIGNLFSFHKKDILLVKKEYLIKAASYMHLTHNNASEYKSDITKLICICCFWQGIFKSYDNALFDKIKPNLICCPKCKLNTVLEDKYSLKQIDKWHKEGKFDEILEKEIYKNIFD